MSETLHIFVFMRNFYSFAYACIALCALVSCNGQDYSGLDRIDDVVDAAIREGNCPGAVVAVVQGDKTVFLRAYGNASVVPDTVAMTADRVFDLASLSKCVGATLSFMQLIGQGKVSLDDPVSEYIPEFAPWRDSTTGETVDITVRDIMTHSSGLDPYPDVPACVERFGEDCPDSLMHHIATESGRNFRPGTDFMYSCLNFVTVQRILEKVTGERLCDYAQRNVFDVLGLKDTRYLPKTSLKSEEYLAKILPTEVREDGLPLLGEVHDPLARLLNGGNSGNAGVFSTAEDLAKIAVAIMHGGAMPDGSHRILAPETVELMATVPEQNAPEVGRALGWDSSSPHAHIRGSILSQDRCICHTGYTGTSMVIDLDRQIAVIILAHRVHPKDVGSMAAVRREIADIVGETLILKK